MIWTIMNILLKEIKIFFSFFFLNNVYDRVFFIENKNYLKDFEKFLAHQNSKKKNNNFIFWKFKFKWYRPKKYYN